MNRDASKLYGKKVGAEGKIYSESGKVIGTAELIPIDDRDVPSGSPFEDFPDATVSKDGHVLFDGVIVGRLIEGDAKKLLGKKIVSIARLIFHYPVLTMNRIKMAKLWIRSEMLLEKLKGGNQKRRLQSLKLHQSTCQHSLGSVLTR